MKSLFRSTNKPQGLLGIAILSACQPDQKSLFRLNEALDAAGLGQKVSVSASSKAVTGDSRYGLVFLMGCENTDRQVEAADAAIRSALARSGTAYQVLYGDANERLSQALKLIEAELLQPSEPRSQSTSDDDGRKCAWVWHCDKCSDPHSEYRLLTDLLANRTTEGGRALY